MTVAAAFPSVVIVENDARTRKYLDRELSKRGYRSRLASTTAEAELFAVQGETRFVIDLEMHEGMGDVSGLALLATLRRRYPHSFLAIYSQFARRHEESARELGADFVLEKSSYRADAELIADAMLRKCLEQSVPKEAPAEHDALAGEALTVLTAGLVVSAIYWRVGLRYQIPELVQTAWLPAFLCFVGTIVRLELAAHRSRTIARWRPYRIYRRVRGFLWASIAGGIVYEIVRSYL